MKYFVKFIALLIYYKVQFLQEFSHSDKKCLKYIHKALVVIFFSSKIFKKVLYLVYITISDIILGQTWSKLKQNFLKYMAFTLSKNSRIPFIFKQKNMYENYHFQLK